ncbi:MAG: succinate dehydrogenase, cytochrome b556 subunit [Rhodospirillaceae bacterium]|jgi:succinate dehydrogenase / fumarate reductase, cytochrome b subunit|nr:succinate dehydrogenase, cytochrome b556 subunit [Rhodospirillaceae bacterium]MBT4219928.1 succinate dehydrogenase, cytochrome b556 subunit [Rhodospirillaceae bacterium]MBT4464949.1 succinate dehydrogenase, cytochrome b556 subunit [Rhodospirillaceae bacterium]MBT5013281.1 succinate dehydrogenase, cytochrome b556 subunit [Rhodospirillaceae bacterium]MBT5308524.1 succinate dehydrogenase, cytochrome b556 subunit [Rhodospirillaceae bacterium]
MNTGSTNTAQTNDGKAVRSRPLSPHLQVYNPQITSILSILHRMFGVALCGGAVLLTYWLSAAAYGPDAFARAQWFFGSWFGQVLLFGLTFSLFYHLANGIRHLFWDVGLGFNMSVLRASGVLVVLVSLGLTVATWVIAYMNAGML